MLSGSVKLLAFVDIIQAVSVDMMEAPRLGIWNNMFGCR